MKTTITRDEKLNSIIKAFTWKRIDSAPYDSLYIYDKVMRSISEHTKYYQTDVLYDVVGNRDRIQAIMKQVEQEVEPEDFQIVPVSVIAIRESGVDGVEFTFSRLDGCTSENRAKSVEAVKSWYPDLFLLCLEPDVWGGKPEITIYRAEIESFHGLGGMGGLEL